MELIKNTEQKVEPNGATNATQTPENTTSEILHISASKLTKRVYSEKERSVSEVENTPFWIVEEKDDTFVTIGKHVIYKAEDLADAVLWIEDITWNKIVHLIATINNITNELRNV